MSKEIYEQNIDKLIAEKYKRIGQINSNTQRRLIIDQLFWVQESKQFTPQADVIYQSGGKWQLHLHREVFRALSRIENMLLLQKITDENFQESYKEFIADQDEKDRLSEQSFRLLGEMFKNLSSQEIDAQIRASLVASITLSPQAIKLAKEKLGEGKYLSDSILFSGHTVRSSGDIYPAYHSASEPVKQILRACFPDDSRHWRHAFFLENAGCLDALKAETKKSESKEQLKQTVQMWLNYWIINASGFNGHIKSLKGSEFMTESVYQRMSVLNETILSLLENADQDVFKIYSERCGEILGLEIQNSTLSLYLIRLLNMTNIFTVKIAQELYLYIKQNNLINLAEEHERVFKTNKVATYVPGFLQNIYAKDPSNFRSLLDAMQWVCQTLEKSDADITSFRLIDSAKVDNLIKSQFQGVVSINPQNGEVSFESKKLEERPYNQ